MRWHRLSSLAQLLDRGLRSRYYVVSSLVLTLVLVTGILVTTLTRVGGWPPAFAQPHPTIAITGPGVTADSTVQAYILGAVRAPGVYTPPQGARVHDLIAAAGGVLTTADLTRVNLASVVNDGQTVYVPAIGEVVPLELGGKIDINTATAAQLHSALGISLSIAQRIVAYRVAHGNFTAISQLLLVPLSRTTYDRIKDLVTV